jgi:hypothetical protein
MESRNWGTSVFLRILDWKSLKNWSVGAANNYLWASLPSVEIFRCNTAEAEDPKWYEQTVWTDGKQKYWEYIATKAETRTDDPDADSMFKANTRLEAACRGSRTRILNDKWSQSVAPVINSLLSTPRISWVVEHQTARDHIIATDSRLRSRRLTKSQEDLYQMPRSLRRKELLSSSTSSTENPGICPLGTDMMGVSLEYGLPRVRIATTTFLKIS